MQRISLGDLWQAFAGLIASTVLPAVLGARHASVPLFLIYALLAGLLFTLGELVSEASLEAISQSARMWERLATMWVSFLLLGSIFYALSYLAGPG